MYIVSAIQPRNDYQELANDADRPIIEIPAESVLSTIGSDLELGRVLSQLELEPHPDEMRTSAHNEYEINSVRSLNGRCSDISMTGTTTKTSLVGCTVGVIAGAIIGAIELSKIHGQNPETGGLWGALAGGSTGAAIGAAIGLIMTGCRSGGQ